ncbi:MULTISPECIES: glycolate oxidase subunit GlcE [unclassified Polaromonas]|uniref:glycolate oxidase subunit GlcE n=1 Tax=unclassified Polaromonas TaxID=2638319 RepID=UPI0018CAC5DD|nr:MULTISPECIES: glycolate oxidase subunit GlcE [unclassified Polaromonas]MBG6071529.1 glycolate oxidase FAD binding subunit [Polaromonas sp. CG_9.7]MBG6113530.1 glycolate oxidase FAD binding subunit [Polaromonas sp. CG_9.2]MDH6183011.1 glycolate oxidase FAD binding subunit [Polaromonas sp. CG_23.6]
MNADTDMTTLMATRIRDAAKAGTPLRIRGGGSKDFYGQTLSGDVLDMADYSGVISYEPSELVVTVRGGTPLAELEALLAEQGQCLPFEPPHFGPHATVGGMVASGLSGPARASSGAVRDYLLGVVLLNGKGECLTFGGQVMKNVAGYDVSRLMAGTLGTLGVLLELSLKVLPVVPGEATLMCSGLSQQKALNLLNRWGGQPLPLNASCWVHDASAAPAQDFLFVRLRGALAAVEAACPRMVADVQAAGGQAVPMDNAQASADWMACREQTLPFFAQPPSPDACLWRLSVPQTAPAMDLPYASLVEWHGGLRWLWAPASAAAQLRQLAAQAGGHATLFRRAALMPENVPVFTPLSPVQSRIQRELKKQFDPAGIFNPGRMPMDG